MVRPPSGKPPRRRPSRTGTRPLTTRSTYHRPEVSHIISLSLECHRESLSDPSRPSSAAEAAALAESGTPAGRARLSNESVLLREPKNCRAVLDREAGFSASGSTFAPQRRPSGPCELLDRGLASVERHGTLPLKPVPRALLSGAAAATESRERPEVVSGCVRYRSCASATRRARAHVPRLCAGSARPSSARAASHWVCGTRKMHGSAGTPARWASLCFLQTRPSMWFRGACLAARRHGRALGYKS
jgi:hypothetical protein